MEPNFKIYLSSLIVLFFVFIASGSLDNTDNSISSNNVSYIDGTRNCLVNYDWVYPSLNNPMGAWKFSSDGTFSSSTKMFGGMSSWGKWQVITPGKIEITYTRTTEGSIPSRQTLKMDNCNTLLVGSTSYSKH